jgi:hypothetical protein
MIRAHLCHPRYMDVFYRIKPESKKTFLSTRDYCKLAAQAELT